jgi:hypothetical protein
VIVTRALPNLVSTHTMTPSAPPPAITRAIVCASITDHPQSSAGRSRWAVGWCGCHSNRGGGLRPARWVCVSSLLFTPSRVDSAEADRLVARDSASAHMPVLRLLRACGITAPPPARYFPFVRFFVRCLLCQTAARDRRRTNADQVGDYSRPPFAPGAHHYHLFSSISQRDDPAMGTRKPPVLTCQTASVVVRAR